VTEFTGSESDPAVRSVCEIEIEIGDRRLTGSKGMPDFPSERRRVRDDRDNQGAVYSRLPLDLEDRRDPKNRIGRAQMNGAARPPDRPDPLTKRGGGEVRRDKRGFAFEVCNFRRSRLLSARANIPRPVFPLRPFHPAAHIRVW